MPKTYSLTFPDHLVAEVDRELRQRQREEPNLTEAQLILQHAQGYWALRARETAQADTAEVNEVVAAYKSATPEKQAELRESLSLTSKSKSKSKA
jgi:hypothetical protein